MIGRLESWRNGGMLSAEQQIGWRTSRIVLPGRIVVKWKISAARQFKAANGPQNCVADGRKASPTHACLSTLGKSVYFGVPLETRRSSRGWRFWSRNGSTNVPRDGKVRLRSC